jgi:hypothetical protein
MPLLWLAAGVTITDDRDRNIMKWTLLAAIVFARGEGKQPAGSACSVARAIPTESSTYPGRFTSNLQSAPLDRERTRMLWFVYSQVNEKHRNRQGWRPC